MKDVFALDMNLKLQSLKRSLCSGEEVHKAKSSQFLSIIIMIFYNTKLEYNKKASRKVLLFIKKKECECDSK